MAIAPTPRRGAKSTADDLREIMAEHSLTQRDVAALACVSIRPSTEPKAEAASMEVWISVSILPRAVVAPPAVETLIEFSAARPPEPAFWY